jgi:hypothetical protein
MKIVYGRMSASVGWVADASIGTISEAEKVSSYGGKPPYSAWGRKHGFPKPIPSKFDDMVLT